jgi:hypothetical protein
MNICPDWLGRGRLERFDDATETIDVEGHCLIKQSRRVSRRLVRESSVKYRHDEDRY